MALLDFFRRRPPAPSRPSTPRASGWLDEVAPRRDDEPLDVRDFTGEPKGRQPRKRPSPFDSPPDPARFPWPR